MDETAVAGKGTWRPGADTSGASGVGKASLAGTAKRTGYMDRAVGRKIMSITNLLFVALLCLQLLPDRRPDEFRLLFPACVVLVQAAYLSYLFMGKGRESVRTAGDLLAAVYGAGIAWQLLTVKLDALDRMLFPSPAFVLSLLVHEAPAGLKGAASSLEILLVGYGTAVVTAVPFGLVSGWRRRLRDAMTPVTRVLGPVPPTVYIPYAIVLLPTFKLSSMFVIFIGAFWPIFINTLNGVSAIDGRIIESAKVLKLDQRTMLAKVIFPGTLPSIVTGATIGLAMSFILLTAAEMIGATSGLGWYVKYFSDFADYPRVIVGIIFTGIVVTCIMYAFDKAEKRLLRWRQ